MFERFRRWLRDWLDLPIPMQIKPKGMMISPAAISDARARGAPAINIWEHLPVPAPGVLPHDITVRKGQDFVTPQIAQDNEMISPDTAALYAWAAQGLLHEGLGFLGYPFLAQLTQRPEYRRLSEIKAQEATRKWIKLTGADDKKLALLMDAVKRFNLQAHFRQMIEHDGFFGRGQIYIDTGDSDNPNELLLPLLMETAKINQKTDLAFRVIEPIWTYPGIYNSSQPWKPDFYKPQTWYVNGATFHATRLLTIVGRPVPDILKPIYQFGGLSTSQMMKPYVDNWIRARQSVNDLIHAFSVMILATDMSSTFAGGGAQEIERRIMLFTQLRDNLGLQVLNKNSEEFSNVSTPLSQLPELLNQAQEQLCSVSGIPIIKFLGKSPGGLNGSSEGEIDTFNVDIHGYQEKCLREPLIMCLQAIQLHEFGAIDEKITFEFEKLDDADETEESDIRKKNAETDQIYVNTGVISEDEVRERLREEEGGLYNGLDLGDEAPGPPAPPIDPNKVPAQDEWNEDDHPRDEQGRFSTSNASHVDILRNEMKYADPSMGHKGYAKRMTAKGLEASAENPDFVSLVEKLKVEKKEDQERAQKEWLASPEYKEQMVKAERENEEKLKPFKQTDVFEKLPSNVREDIRLFAKYDPYRAIAEMDRQTVTAIAKEAKASGFSSRHTSKGKDGKVTSRYLTFPGGGEVRVSDHYLPDTPERQASGGGRWVGEYVVNENWRHDSLSKMMEIIKAKSLGTYEEDEET